MSATQHAIPMASMTEVVSALCGSVSQRTHLMVGLLMYAQSSTNRWRCVPRHATENGVNAISVRFLFWTVPICLVADPSREGLASAVLITCATLCSAAFACACLCNNSTPLCQVSRLGPLHSAVHIHLSQLFTGCMHCIVLHCIILL